MKLHRPEHWYIARLQNVDVTREYLHTLSVRDIRKLIQYELAHSRRERTLNVLHAKLYKRLRKTSWNKILSILNLSRRPEK